jgi:hypothetical protein
VPSSARPAGIPDREMSPKHSRPQRPGPRADDLHDRFEFHIADLGALGVACYVARHVWYATHFAPVTWPLVAAVWLLFSAGRAGLIGLMGGSLPLPRYRWAVPLLAAGLCAVLVKLLAQPFSWRQAEAFALMLAALLGANRVLLGLIVRSREPDRSEGARFAVAQAAALFAVHPYVRSALLGAGDALSYSLTVADFRAQRIAGIFPVLIGQSRFAFNGNFQPLRNAPLFPHLSWAIDVLSRGTLNAFALENLAVLASMLGAVLGCYGALRISSPRNAWLALGLAVLYGLCPGVLAPLYGGDMYITFMTLPFIPWFVLSLERSSASPERAWPWALQGAALAAMWLGHPPVAVWATLLAALSALFILLRDRRWEIVGRMTAAPAALVLLSAYLAVSVYSLRLPVLSAANALPQIDYKVEKERAEWVRTFLPVDRTDSQLLGDIQLGYGLWACLLVALAFALRARSGRSLSACLAAILVFAWPIPFLSPWAWSHLPLTLLVITNQWPTERFYVLMAGVSIFIIFAGLGRYSSRGRGPRTAVAVLVTGACLWSATETFKFFRRASEVSHSEADSAKLHLPENTVLSRTHSYEYTGTPRYVSFGHMDPRLETRLIDAASLRPFADGATLRAAPAGAVAGARTVVLHEAGDGIRGERLRVGPGEAYVLRFDFLGKSPQGELQIEGGSVDDVYELPQSGKAGSFGSGPDAARALILENCTQEPDDVEFRFVGKAASSGSGVFADVSVERLAPQDLAIRLASLTPFHAGVSASRACFLETPRLYVPGYAAVVDGRSTPVARSLNGLVEVRLPPGEHDVVVAYAGSRLLRACYLGCGGAWLLLFGAVGTYAFQDTSPLAARLSRLAQSAGGAFGRWAWEGWIKRAVVAVVLVSAAVGLAAREGLFARTGGSDVRLTVMLPPPPIGTSEPLVTTGHAGAGDFIYLTYLDGNHVLVGHDKWGFGGGKSLPIPVDYVLPQSIEVSLGGPPAGGKGPGGLSVRWNGALVYSEPGSALPRIAREVKVGENTIGGSTTLPRFTGEILSVERGDRP